MSDTLEQTAQEIAERGREALIERLRPAYAAAAAANADVLALSDEQVEAMVQRAAGRADGLQWRRALAIVASEALGISLGEALGHPAVARAQAVVGAPSYEESLAQLAAPREPPDPPGGPDAAGEPALRIAAIHLSGIADLAPEEDGLELVFSDAGLDISRAGQEPLGRLGWSEIGAVEVVAPRGVRRRRRREAHLVISTSEGEADFQVPAVSPDELRRQLAPVLERYP